MKIKPSSLFAIILVSFLVALVLFVSDPLQPIGAEDLIPPTLANFTRTTTVKVDQIHVCSLAYFGNGAIQGNCYQAYSGLLQIPVGPITFPIWIASFAIALTVFFVWYRSGKAHRATL